MKQQDIVRATDLIDSAFEIVNEVAQEFDLHESSVLNALLQSYWDEDFGLLDGDTSEEASLMVLEAFAENNIPYMAIGSYRICFHFNGMVMKINRYNFDHGNDTYKGENEEELFTWEKYQGTEGEKYLLPILDHFEHHHLGEVLFVPYAETIDEQLHGTAYGYFSGYTTEASIIAGLTEVMSDEYLSKEVKDFCIQYGAISRNFSDDHSGNWGIYNGDLVCIDFASFNVAFSSETKVMQMLKKYRKKLGVCHG